MSVSKRTGEDCSSRWAVGSGLTNVDLPSKKKGGRTQTHAMLYWSERGLLLPSSLRSSLREGNRSGSGDFNFGVSSGSAQFVQCCFMGIMLMWEMSSTEFVRWKLATEVEVCLCRKKVRFLVAPGVAKDPVW